MSHSSTDRTADLGLADGRRTGPAIRPVPATRPDLLAFRIFGQVTRDDMRFTADIVNAALDVHGKIDMLLVFDALDGVDLTANMSLSALKSEGRAASQVERYAVVGAPALASAMIEAAGQVLPVTSRSFSRTEEDAAWAWVSAAPEDRGRSLCRHRRGAGRQRDRPLCQGGGVTHGRAAPPPEPSCTPTCHLNARRAR